MMAARADLSPEEIRLQRLSRACPISGRPGSEAVLFCEFPAGQAVRSVGLAECSALWAGVLQAMLDLAFNPTRADRKFEILQARSWVFSRDAETVCDLAGIDHDALKRVARARLDGAPDQVRPDPDWRGGRGRARVETHKRVESLAARSAARDARHARIRALAAKGEMPSNKALAERFGVTESTISMDLKALGLHASGRDMASQRQNRLAALAEAMDAPGFSIEAFAAEYRVVPEVVRRDLSGLRGAQAAGLTGGAV